MTPENAPENLSLEYVDAPGLRTVFASGVVLSRSIGEAGMAQLIFYADVSRLAPENLTLKGKTEIEAVYERSNEVHSEPYRENQVRVLLTPQTLRELASLIERTNNNPVHTEGSDGPK